jgi:hypothetical protein
MCCTFARTRRGRKVIALEPRRSDQPRSVRRDSLPTTPVDAGDKRISPTAITVTGGTLVEAVDGHPVWDADVITPREQPLQEDDGIAVLRGNLAPRGAIVKPAAASPELLVHRDQQ